MSPGTPVILSRPGLGVGGSAIAPETRRDLSLRIALVCLLAAVATVTVPFVEHVVLYSLVCVLAACVVLPLWYDWSRGKLDFFAPIHVFGFIYFLDFGMGSIWTVQDPGRVAYDLHIVPFVPRAVFYCLLGYLAALAGYYLPWIGQRPSRTTEEVPRGISVVFITGITGLVGFLALAMWTRALWVGASIAGIVSSIGQLAPLYLFAWALAWLLFFSGQGGLPLRLVLFGMLMPGAAAICYLTISTKWLVLTLAGLPMIARWYARHKVPWKSLLLLLLVLVFVIFPFYNTFRWSDPHLSQTERLGATVDQLTRWDMDSYQLSSVGTVKRRMALINSVAIVVRDVGRWVPFARGETLFGPMLSYFVPRILWPDKPMTTEGKEFGRRFRITGFFTRQTYIASTIPGELYWNFDLPGIVVGMALVGLGLGAIYRRYGCGVGTDPIRRAIYLVLLVAIAKMVEAALAPTFVSILRTIAMLELVRWIGLANRAILRRAPSAGS